MLQAPRSRLLLKLNPVQIPVANRTISRTFSLCTLRHSRYPIHIPQTNHTPSTRTMSSFSNADTGSKPADPYTAKNKDEPGVEEKLTTLDKFITSRKFGMMTTRDPSSGKLVSRCMAIAAKVSKSSTSIFTVDNCSRSLGEEWHRAALLYQHRIEQDG